ncbi:MAG: stage II sporulation protein M [Sphingomonadaceae bacterium]
MSESQDLVAAGQRNFRRQHEADWDELEALLKRVEGGRAKALSVEELIRLPVLYRAVLSSLAVARETSLDKAMIDYLEALCTRAYFFIYGVRTRARDGIAHFFTYDWPSAVANLWKETLVSALLLLAGAVAGYLLVAADPSWYGAIIGDDMAQGRGPESSAAMLRDIIYSKDPLNNNGSALSIFATFLFTHNTQVSIWCFALGFAFGVPTAFLIVSNGCAVGALLHVYAAKGLGWNLVGWLMIHGTTELFAITLAGAAGFRIGLATAFPGDLGRVAAAAKAGRTAATVMIGVIVMLFFAGILEGFGRQLITNDIARYGVGLFMLCVWLAYFYLLRNEAPRG